MSGGTTGGGTMTDTTDTTGTTRTTGTTGTTGVTGGGEGLAPELLTAGRSVHVLPDRSGATVGDRTIEADSPRELRRLLADALYQELHAGLDVGDEGLPFRLRDPEFEKLLAEGVPHRSTTLRAVMVSPGEESHLVELGGVRVRVPVEQVRAAEGAVPGSLVEVVNTPLRPALSPGFFLVEGTAPHRSAELLRLYVHITGWTFAPAIWRSALHHLEGCGAVYRAKVVSSTYLYPRRDALVVYLDESSAHVAPGLAEVLADLPGVGSRASLFTRRIRPGVATAWEPRDPAPGMQGLSFGQHRAGVLAEALVDTADDPEAFPRVLRTLLVRAGVDPEDPSRNISLPAA
ncbi:T3SS effector HopA1 family protein [Streptomyces cyaneofuscatus]|uniref:T3SS effector HopA1 family protein n=1 Tax=Streptomyces cyaneofuscatus TaxID=66883 RepID=UPI00364E5F20